MLGLLLFSGLSSVVAAPPYPLAIACATKIDFKGNAVLVDSFDSTTNTASQWISGWGFGIYTSAKARGNGNVATHSSQTNACHFGPAIIFGHVATGEGGSVALDDSGYVGPRPQTGMGLQPGYFSSDMDLGFPEVRLPAGASDWQKVSANNVITNSGCYWMAGISNSLTIDASNVTIYVAGNISLVVPQNITISTNANRVVLYVAGPVIDFHGIGNVNNRLLKAATFSLYGLPTLDRIDISGNAAFVGMIYAPQTSFEIGGGGNNTQDFIGSLMVKSILLNGKTGFHFDESLADHMPLGTGEPVPVRVARLGGDLALGASVGGGSILGCQWFFNQTNAVSGATNLSLSLTNLQPAAAGSYCLVATNFSYAITSPPCQLMVAADNISLLLAPKNSANHPGFTVAGVEGVSYSVETSSNLLDWLPLTTNQAPFVFTDSNANLSPQRFYRSLYAP